MEPSPNLKSTKKNIPGVLWLPAQKRNIRADSPNIPSELPSLTRGPFWAQRRLRRLQGPKQRAERCDSGVSSHRFLLPTPHPDKDNTTMRTFPGVTEKPLKNPRRRHLRTPPNRPIPLQARRTCKKLNCLLPAYLWVATRSVVGPRAANECAD